MELTLLCLDKEGVLEEALQDSLDMVGVLPPRLGKNLNIVQINQKKQLNMSLRTSFTNT